MSLLDKLGIKTYWGAELHTTSSGLQPHSFVVDCDGNVGKIVGYNNLTKLYHVEYPDGRRHCRERKNLKQYSCVYSAKPGDSVLVYWRPHDKIYQGHVEHVGRSTCRMCLNRIGYGGNSVCEIQKEFVVREKDWVVSQSSPTLASASTGSVMTTTFKKGDILEHVSGSVCMVKKSYSDGSFYIEFFDKTGSIYCASESNYFKQYSDLYTFKVGDDVCVPIVGVKGKFDKLIRTGNVQVNHGTVCDTYRLQELVHANKWVVSATAKSSTPSTAQVANFKTGSFVMTPANPAIVIGYDSKSKLCEVRKRDGTRHSFLDTSLTPYFHLHPFSVGDRVYIDGQGSGTVVSGGMCDLEVKITGGGTLDIARMFVVHESVWVAGQSAAPSVLTATFKEGDVIENKVGALYVVTKTDPIGGFWAKVRDREEIPFPIGNEFKLYSDLNTFKEGDAVVVPYSGLTGNIIEVCNHEAIIAYDHTKRGWEKIRALVHMCRWQANEICPDCKGTGKILMLNNYVDCKCASHTKDAK